MTKVVEEEISSKDIEIVIKRWFFYLSTKKWLLFGLALSGGIIALTYAYLKKPTYTAKLTFALEDNSSRGGMGGALGLASQLGFDLSAGAGGAFTGENILELFKSRTIIKKAFLNEVEINGRVQTLADSYINFKGLREIWRERGEDQLINLHFRPDDTLSLLQDSLINDFHSSFVKESLKVGKLDKKLSIAVVEIETENEKFSKYFTESLVREVSKFYISSKTKKAADNVSILQRQTDSVRAELRSAISGVAVAVDLNPNLNMARQVLRAPSQKRQVDVQANTAILTELVKNLELAKVTLRKEQPLLQIIDSPVFPLEKKKLSKPLFFIIGSLAAFLLAVIGVSVIGFLFTLKK